MIEILRNFVGVPKNRDLAFQPECAVVDRIIRHLELTFMAEKPPPVHVFEQVALMAAEDRDEYEKRVRPRGERPNIVWLYCPPSGVSIGPVRVRPSRLWILDSGLWSSYSFCVMGRPDFEPEDGALKPGGNKKFLS